MALISPPLSQEQSVTNFDNAEAVIRHTSQVEDFLNEHSASKLSIYHLKMTCFLIKS